MATWSPPPLPPRLEAARRATLVGRHGELETLSKIWDEIENGQSQVVFIGGEPGAGKTRLVAELAGAVHHQDALVLVGTSSADATTPYQPIREMLDHLFISNPANALEDHVEKSGPELHRLSAAAKRHHRLPEGGGEPSGEVRKDLFDSIATLIRSLAVDRPITLIFEDLHWAPPPTVAMLEHVVRTVSDMPLLVVATFRTTPPDRSDTLAEAMAELHRLEGVRRIDLGGLDIDAIAEYVSARGGVPIREARAPAAILRDRTGGNPFFLRELWLDLEQRGGVAAIRSTYRVPASIEETLRNRLASLGAKVRQVIEMAAVLGDSFDLPTLVTASEVDRATSLAALDTAMALRLIEASPEAETIYAFSHSLSRQAVLDLMPQSRQRILHARAAEALERQGVDESVIPRIAHHYLTAQVLGYQQEALDYCTRAGRQAEQALAFEEASMWFERSAALPGVSNEEKVGLLHSAALNHVRAGSFAQGRELFDRLARSTDPLVRLQGAVGYEDANWRPGLAGPHAADLLTAAIEACGLDETDSRYIIALASLGRALAFAGETERARTVGMRAIGLARDLGEPKTLRHALRASLWHGLTPDVAEVQLARSRELSQLSIAASDWESLGAAAYFRAMVGYLSGHREDVDQGQGDCLRSARATGQPFFEYVAACVSGGMAFIRGDFESSSRWSEEALAIGQRFGSDETEGPHGVQMYVITRERGELDRYRHFFDGSESFHGRWVPGLLAIYTEIGLEDGMRRGLRHLLNRDLPAHRFSAQWPLELVFMVEAAAALEDQQAANELIPLLTHYEGKNLVAGQFVAPLGSADRFLGRLHALTGNSEKAESYFASALQLDQAMGSVVHAAETLAYHALFAVSEGNGTRGSELAGQARALSEPIGHQRVLDLIAKVSSGPEHTSGLTAREVDVLKLLAEGLSNKEISERLFISQNTAANHVRSILIKTGAANRTQAAMFAAERNLV